MTGVIAATRAASWYHCSVKVITRSTGRTAIAAAAYRSGTRLHDNQLDKTYDYTRRSGVEASFIVAPENAPAWTYDLETLWNQAQAKDNRVNSCLARECELALPSELDAATREELAREFAEHLADRYGVAVSVALHEPSRHGDERNYHAHIMFTTRRMDAEGLGKKTRQLDERKTGAGEIEHIREYTASLINSYLEDAGSDERVDHRSFKDRGIEQTPTGHLGVEATSLERRGEQSRIGDENRATSKHNRNLDGLVNERAALDAEIAAIGALGNKTDPEPEINPSFPTAPEMPTAQEPALTWEEQKAKAQSPFGYALGEEFKRDIEEYGEIREYGLGRNWYDRTVVMFDNLYNVTREVVRAIRDSWRQYIGNREREEPDKGDIER